MIGARPAIRLRAAPLLVALALLSVMAAVIVHPSEINYDLEYAMSWGRALAGGHAPGYAIDSAPTPHPLTTLVSAVVALPGGSIAPTVWHILADVSYAGLVLVAALLAAQLFSWPAGLVAGAVIGVSNVVLDTTATAFQDVATAMLILLAVLLEVRRPRRGVAPLVVLSVAGLLRPEVWGLAAAYWLARAFGQPWRENVRLAALALVAPVAWLLTDLVITGDPLFSLLHTRSGAEVAHRTTGLGSAPQALLDDVSAGMDLVVLAGGVAGAVVVTWLVIDHRRRRRSDVPGDRDEKLLVPTATLALLCAAFLALGAAKLPLLPRYAIGIDALLGVLFAFMATCALHAGAGRVRVAALVLGLVLVVGEARRVPGQVDSTRASLRFHAETVDILDGLNRLASDPRFVSAVRRCPTLAVTSYRTRPYLAYELDRQPETIVLARTPAQLPPRGLAVVPASSRAQDVFTLLGRSGPPLPTAPRGYATVAGNGSWVARARGC